jgi:hypothetical protein
MPESTSRYGVKRPTVKGGHPIQIDIASSLEVALDDLKYWKEQEGENAILVKESKAQDSTWWIEIKGY